MSNHMKQNKSLVATKSSSFVNVRKLNHLAEQLKGKSSTKTFKAMQNPMVSTAFQNMVSGNKVGSLSGIKPLQFRGGSMMQMTDFRKGM